MNAAACASTTSSAASIALTMTDVSITRRDRLAEYDERRGGAGAVEEAVVSRTPSLLLALTVIALVMIFIAILIGFLARPAH